MLDWHRINSSVSLPHNEGLCGFCPFPGHLFGTCYISTFECWTQVEPPNRTIGSLLRLLIFHCPDLKAEDLFVGTAITLDKYLPTSITYHPHAMQRLSWIHWEKQDATTLRTVPGIKSIRSVWKSDIPKWVLIYRYPSNRTSDRPVFQICCYWTLPTSFAEQKIGWSDLPQNIIDANS